MYEEKISIREHIALFKRTFLLVNRLAPGITIVQLLQALCRAALPFITIYMSARILNEMAGARSVSRLTMYVITAIASSLGAVILRSVFACIYSRMNLKVTANQEIMLSDKAYNIPHQMAEDRDITQLRKTIEANAESGVGGLFEALWFTNNFFQYACAVALAIGLTAGMFASAGGAAWLALGIAVIIALAVICVHRLKVNAVIRKLYESIGESKMLYDFYMAGYIDDSRAAKDIRIFGTAGFVARELRRRIYEPQYAVRKRQVSKEGNHSVLTIAITALLGGAVYVLTAVQAWNGRIGVGDVVKYYGGITQLIAAAASLIVALFALGDNNYCLKPLFRYLDLPEQKHSGSIPFAGMTDEIRFADVCFRYPHAARNALNHCSLSIRRGEHVAIVGKNGSGKSTFVKLLCRLYAPQSGKITMDGVDAADFVFDDYQRHLAVVFQDYRLFAFGIGENVAGGGDYDARRVWQALARSGLRERVEQLPKKLEHALYKDFYEDGVELSGGEEQKLAIARALCKQADVLILDEPTAALDPISESEIYENFADIARNKTVIYISHRLSSCKFCDRIAVFDGGEIVQLGTHAELVSDAEGLYAQMWYAQADYYR